MEDSDLSQAVADLKGRWKEACQAADGHAQALQSCGLEGGASDSARLPRLNAAAQDCLATLRSLQRQFELLAQQLSSVEERESSLRILEEWKYDYQLLHSTLRSANLQAKTNIQKAAKMERDLLLDGGQESTNLRRNLQTQAGMSTAAESITESLRRTRQMMVQELERGANTLATLGDSNTTLKKAETEYKGQQSLLLTTRGLLTALKKQDIIDRIILVAGFIFFSLVVSYVFHQRIRIFKTQRDPQLVSRAQESHQIKPPLSTDIPQISQTSKLQQSPEVTAVERLQYESDGAVVIDTTSANLPDSLPTFDTEL